MVVAAGVVVAVVVGVVAEVRLVVAATELEMSWCELVHTPAQ